MPTPEKPTTLSPAYSFVGAEVSPNEYKGVNPPCIHITPMEQTALFAHSPALASLTPCWNGSRSYVRRNGVSDAWWECVNSGVRNGFLGNPVNGFAEPAEQNQ